MNKETIHLYKEDVTTQRGLDMARSINPAIQSLIKEAIKDRVSLRDLESVLISEVAILISEAVLTRNLSDYKNKKNERTTENT